MDEKAYENTATRLVKHPHRWSLGSAVKQGYLIKFHRGLIKIPKMQYFVLNVPSGLTWFNYKPDQDTTIPVGCLPLNQITSIKVDTIELNSCMLSCLEIIISHRGSNCLLAFSRQEERDEWMVALMAGLGEALVSAKAHEMQESACKLPKSAHVISISRENSALATAVTQIHGMACSHLGQESKKRRKRNRPHSLRRSKSSNNLADDMYNEKNELLADETHVDVYSTVSYSYEPQRKRKSEPDVHEVLADFTTNWRPTFPKDSTSPAGDDDNNMKVFRSTCFDHRDSFELILSRQCAAALKCNDDVKSNIFTRIISKFEQSTRLMH